MAAMNNPLNGNMISQEPHFHGDRDKTGLSALEFITRLDNLFRSVGDSPEERRAFGARAVNMLHGKAHTWFHNGLTFTREAAQLEAQTSWTTLKELIQDEYDIITESADVSTNWGTLKQTDKETAAEFYSRVANVMSEYMKVAPTIAFPNPNDPIMVNLNLLRQEHLETMENNLQRQLLTNRYQEHLLAFMRETATRVRKQMLADLATKTLAEGLILSDMKELVRQAERERVPFVDIAIKIKNKQKSISNKKANKQAAKLTATSAATSHHGHQAEEDLQAAQETLQER